MGEWRLVGNEVQQQAQTKTMKAFSPYQSPEDKTDNSSHAPYLVYNALLHLIPTCDKACLTGEHSDVRREKEINRLSRKRVKLQAKKAESTSLEFTGHSYSHSYRRLLHTAAVLIHLCKLTRHNSAYVNVQKKRAQLMRAGKCL